MIMSGFKAHHYFQKLTLEEISIPAIRTLTWSQPPVLVLFNQICVFMGWGKVSE